MSNSMEEKMRVEDNFLIINVRVAGKEYHKFIFDTGAQSSILDEEVAQQLNLRHSFVFFTDDFPPPPLIYKSIDIPLISKLNVGYRSSATISFVGQSSVNKNKFIWSKKSFLKTMGISGILGWDFIKKHNWIIDARNKNIKMINPKKTKLDFNSPVLSLKIKEKRVVPTVEILLGKEEYFQVGFDTGSDGFLDIGNNIFNEIENTEISNTFYGENRAKSVLLDSILINGLLFKNVRIGTDSKLETHKKLLGLSFMFLFDKIIIDNKNDKILFFKEK